MPKDDATEPTMAVVLRWDRAEGVTAGFANQFVIQSSPGGEIFLSVGQFHPPIISGGEEQDLDAAYKRLEGSELQVTVLGIYEMTPFKLIELAAMLGKHVQDNYAELLEHMQKEQQKSGDEK